MYNPAIYQESLCTGGDRAGFTTDGKAPPDDKYSDGRAFHPGFHRGGVQPLPACLNRIRKEGVVLILED